MTNETSPELDQASHRVFGRALNALDDAEKRVLKLARGRKLIARPPSPDDDADSFGDRLADGVAQFGGSWTFIVIFGVILAIWAVANVWLLTRPFDAYPFIFLNLMLSMLAAIQAPIIMMSQNRQSAKDRRQAELDYEVNLKAEIEIMALHDKLDALRNDHLVALVAKQEEQIALLTRLLEQRPLR
ncbi:DUF1003 domain-containing protein [Chenggangzhangella methanolivorans]|uniref:DUF1003 domain-containing protein n=1 Tax=Chenggangzhangella methanolivorans TaxID=1437009 RepID=A0A9E6RA43_9HYPH|nr:DUF1003 domain-containing protein [Chenggangzhangella methanolivorans]QZN99442.1 DUF1003 domain-containing protein [Chenggangzhangella methanolivorans]